MKGKYIFLAIFAVIGFFLIFRTVSAATDSTLGGLVGDLISQIGMEDLFRNMVTNAGTNGLADQLTLSTFGLAVVRFFLVIILFSLYYMSLGKVFGDKKNINIAISVSLSILSVLAMPSAWINRLYFVFGWIVMMLALIAILLIAHKLIRSTDSHVVQGIVFIIVAACLFALGTLIYSFMATFAPNYKAITVVILIAAFIYGFVGLFKMFGGAAATPDGEKPKPSLFDKWFDPDVKKEAAKTEADAAKLVDDTKKSTAIGKQHQQALNELVRIQEQDIEKDKHVIDTLVKIENAINRQTVPAEVKNQAVELLKKVQEFEKNNKQSTAKAAALNAHITSLGNVALQHMRNSHTLEVQLNGHLANLINSGQIDAAKLNAVQAKIKVYSEEVARIVTELYSTQTRTKLQSGIKSLQQFEKKIESEVKDAIDELNRGNLKEAILKIRQCISLKKQQQDILTKIVAAEKIYTEWISDALADMTKKMEWENYVIAISEQTESGIKKELQKNKFKW